MKLLYGILFLGVSTVLSMGQVWAQGTNNTISMIANLKSEDTLVGNDDRRYTVSSFQFNESSAKELCPGSNCEYDLENGQYRPFLVGGGYVFEGEHYRR